MKVLQYRHPDGLRLAMVDEEGSVIDIAQGLRRRGVASTFTGALAAARAEPASLADLAAALAAESDAARLTLHAEEAVVAAGDVRFPIATPVDAPEVWASGVTYVRSRAARMEESGAATRDFYDRVYEAERPELFMKDANGRRTVATGEFVGVRADSTWTVPEPELALVVDNQGSILAYTVANDVTARDVEAQNPLYLPQAKVFTRSCSLGPVALLADDSSGERMFTIELRIEDEDGRALYQESISTSAMRRSFSELTDYLCRYNTIADGTVLLTGTGLVPPDDYALRSGHRVEVEIDGIGTLWNPVQELAR